MDKFQQILVEYFRSLKSEKHDFQIADIHVEDNGVGVDDGCDNLVEFHFEDVIGRHCHRWIIECKSQKKAVSLEDISTNNLESILKAITTSKSPNVIMCWHQLILLR